MPNPSQVRVFNYVGAPLSHRAVSQPSTAAAKEKQTGLSVLSSALVGKNTVGEERPGIKTIARGVKLIRVSMAGRNDQGENEQGAK